MNRQFIEELNKLSEKRGLDVEELLGVVEESLVQVTRKELGIKSKEDSDAIVAEIDRFTGEMTVTIYKTVVEDVEDPHFEISLEEASTLNGGEPLEVGVELGFNYRPEEFGTLAAKAGANALKAKLAQIERDHIQREFNDSIGRLVEGTVAQVFDIDATRISEVLVDIATPTDSKRAFTEAILSPRERSRSDNYDKAKELRTKMQFLVLGVEERHGRPTVMLSRKHPDLISRLFEKEVPEIADGIVEVVKVARDAGFRSKVAVYSHDANIEPVGACVGPRGVRIQAIRDELQDEQIDIVRYNNDPIAFIVEAMSPVKAINVMLDEASHSARVVVPDRQLSLAIGRSGRQARLVNWLTGWTIDIRSESQQRSEIETLLTNQFAAGLSLEPETAEADLLEAEQAAVNTDEQ